MTREDYEAAREAQYTFNQMIDKEAISESITFTQLQWDSINERACIGRYNAGLILEEPGNVLAQERFISDSYTFLNKLNESFKVQGYHIGMTEDLNGYYYIGKDKTDTNLQMTSKKDEYNGFEEAAYRHYLLNKAYLQSNMKRNIQEALIITDNSLSYEQRVQALTEGLGDSLSDAWEKFKAFLNKIWLKFNEFISRTVNSDRAYLTKYKEIIQKREYKVDGLSIDDDYHVGITRISQYGIYTPSVGDLDSFPAENNDANIKIVQQKVFPAYQSGVEFSDFCKTYFLGGTGKAKELSGAEVNLNEMYSFCFNYDKIQKVLQKNKKTLDDAIAPFEQALKQKIADTSAQQPAAGASVTGQAAATTDTSTATVVQTASSGTAVAGSGTAVANANGSGQNQQPNQQQQTATDKITNIRKADDGVYLNGQFHPAKKEKINGQVSTSLAFQKYQVPQNLNGLTVSTYAQHLKNGNITESASIYNTHMGRILHEAVTQAGSSSGGGTPSAARYNANGNVVVRAGAADAYGQQRASGTGTVGDTLKTEEILRTKLNMYQSTASTIFAAMCTAAQTIKKDYMTIIKKHVQSYLGEDENEGKVGVQSVPTYGAENVAKFDLNRIQQDLNTIAQIRQNPEGNRQTQNILLDRATQDTEMPIAGDTSGTKAPTIRFTSLDQYEEFLKKRQEALNAAQQPQQNQQQTQQPAQQNPPPAGT